MKSVREVCQLGIGKIALSTNRSLRREEAPTSLGGNRPSLLTSAATRFMRRVAQLCAALWFFVQMRATAADFFQPVQPPRAVQVMVHRGAAMQAPENTRPALEHCIEDQLEWAEVDVRRTFDGLHVLWHNDSVTDTNSNGLKIKESLWSALRQVDVGAPFAARFAGTPMLTLKECFALCKGRLNLYLDCKSVNPEQLAREIVDAGMEKQVVAYLKLEDCRRAQRVSKGKVATMTKWRRNLGGVEWAVTNGLAAVEVDAPELTPETGAAFRRVGIKVQAKVLDDWDKPEFWDRAMAAGADWLQTDLPEEVLAQALWRRVPKRPVQISLHRGANRYAPENTLPAFEKSVRLGADYVEFDVRTTKDGQYFLLHDSRLNRTTDGQGPISEMTADDVRKLSAGVKFGLPFAKTPVPTMGDFMAAFAGKIGFYFDAKAIPPQVLADALTRHQMVDRTVVYQSAGFIAQLRAINPQIRGLPPLGKPEELDELAKSKPYGVDTDWSILSKELIARCHAHGIKVFSDALGEHEKVEDYLQAMEWGIDVIQTDYPLRVMRAIELWALRHPSGRKQ